MSYVLVTTEDKVRWCKYKFDKNLEIGDFELLEVLDLKQIPLLGDKVATKDAAKALGLKTWRYVKI